MKRTISFRMKKYMSAFLWLWIIFLGMYSAPFSARGEETHPILIISSYNPDTKNTTANITEFQNEYSRLGGTGYFQIENMNCKSLPEATLWKDRMAGILNKYQGDRVPRLILILGQEAWSSYISQDSVVFKDVPVLCGMISRNAIFLPDSSDAVYDKDGVVRLSEWEPTYVDIKTYEEETPLGGQFYSFDVSATVGMILRLYPETRNIALVTDNTYGGIALQTFVKKEMENMAGINLILLDGRKNDIYSIVDQIKTLPENTAILMGTWRVDMNDGYFLGNATHTMMTANPTIPAFSLTSIGLGYWTIGGYVPDYDNLNIGKELARQAVAIFQGKIDKKDIKPEIIPNKYIFDARKLKELNIDKRLLPSGYSLINNDQNIFVRYKFEILILVITILLAFLIMVFIFFIRTKNLKDKLLDLQEDNVLIMNNMQSSIRFIKPDFTVKWENQIDFPCTPEFGPDNCFLSENAKLPYCTHCTVVKAMRTKKIVEITRRCNDNSRYLHVLSAPVFDEKQNLLGVVFKKEDVTNQKIVEHELRLAKDKAEESDRLKSAFLANMSHEIRTPLNAIVGFSGLLSVTEDMEERVEYMNIINTNNDLLLQLINDILDLAKIEAGTLDFVYGDVDINRIFTDIEQTSRLKVKPGVELAFVEKIPNSILFTDKNRISQVITNFINNAIKFTDEGSITFGYRHEDNELYFYVKDTGCGMSKEGADQVFTRFVKLNSFAQGTGLGLSICEMIVRKLNGEIGVDSELGKGSTFWFRLPDTILRSHSEVFVDTAVESAAPDTGSDTAITVPRRSDTGMSRKLLLAEDNDSNYILFKSMLSDFELCHVWNGQDAVYQFDKFKPDIVLMDIKMPVMDGYEAVAKIREIDKDVPIIAVTAYALADDEKHVKENGFTDYIAKPINPEKLLNMIDTYLFPEDAGD